MFDYVLFLKIVFCSAVVYIFIALAIRLFGKKELAQLSVLDLVFVLLISNAVQNSMVNGDSSSLINGLIAAATLFVLNFILKWLIYNSKLFKRIVEGEPMILVSKGKVNDRNMRKLMISTDELVEAVHEHGISSIREVDLAIFEVDGNISILSNNYSKRTVRSVGVGRKHIKKNSSVFS